MTHLCLSLQQAQELKTQLSDDDNMKAQTVTVGVSPIKPASVHSTDINLSPFLAEVRWSNPDLEFATWLRQHG